MLVKVRVALSVPLTCGLKVTVKGTLFPAEMTAGNDKPLIVKRELFVLAAVTVTFATLALRLPEAVPLVPTTTLPTAKVAGVAVNCPAAIVPVPARDIDKVGLVPLDVTATLPLALLADEGVKVTVKVALCAAASVTGVEIPLNAKPVPLIPTLEIVRVEPPVLVTLSDNRRLLPTWTVPKSRLVGLAPSAPGVTPVPETAIDTEGFTASDVMVTLPLEVPVVAGAKLIVKVVFAEAFNASGVAIPLSLNPLPLAEA